MTSGKSGQMCTGVHMFVYVYMHLCAHVAHGQQLLSVSRTGFPWTALWAPGSAEVGQVVGSGLQQTDFMSVFLQHLSIKGNII